ncbi:MAG: UDP-3-O-(3-hydroxymyristoyl)glucosamine N-acyltransferase [Vicinamibacterales bacterium]
MKLRELAERLACRLEGDGEIEIRSVAGLLEAGPGDISFLANNRYTSSMLRTRASAVILGEDAPAAPCAMLRSKNPYLAFAEAMTVFAAPEKPEPGIHPFSCVADDAVIGEAVYVGPFVVIDGQATIGARTIIHPHVYVGHGARVGEDCLIHSNVAIRERTIVGNRVIVQNGAVIGSDGFGFAPRPDGTYQKIPQSSIVVIEDDVEIGANTTVDRPALGETRIAAGAKIDNLVQIAHGVAIGRNTVLSAQVGVAGSTKVGDQVILAGQVGVADHITVGNGVRATAQTGIAGSVPDGAFISGYPAIENREWLKASTVFRHLPELRRTVLALERRIAELEARLAETAT